MPLRTSDCIPHQVRLGGRIVKEVGVTLEAGPTDAKATELLMVPPPKGNDVLISAGGVISFNLQPKDRFSNSSELREDARPKHFTWRLQRVQLKTKPPDDDDDDFPLYPKPVPIEEAATHSFTSLTGTSVGVTVAGDYDLTVQHDGLTVKGKPVRIKAEPDALSPPHITMHGSGLHDAYVDWDKPVDRFVLLTGRDAYSNWMGKMVPNFRESIHVTLRNQDKDGTNPMVELNDVGEGVLRLTYGVRMHGQFVLSIAFGSTLLLAKKITIGRIADRPADCPPDSFELWMTQFSLQVELDRLEAVAREEERQKELARLAAEKAEDERLFAEWGATVTPTLVKAAVPTAVIAAIQAHHRKLRDLHASFSAPPEGPAAAAGVPPKLGRRAWNLLTRFSKLVERPEGMGRRTLSALYEELTSGVTEKAGGAFSLTALPPSGDGSDKDGLGLSRFGLALSRTSARGAALHASAHHGAIPPHRSRSRAAGGARLPWRGWHRGRHSHRPLGRRGGQSQSEIQYRACNGCDGGGGTGGTGGTGGGASGRRSTCRRDPTSNRADGGRRERRLGRRERRLGRRERTGAGVRGPRTGPRYVS